MAGGSPGKAGAHSTPVTIGAPGGLPGPPLPGTLTHSYFGSAAMKTFVHCGQLFTGREDEAQAKQTLVFDEAGVVDYVGAEGDAPRRTRNDRALDYSSLFVMPGLIDVHT